MLAAHGRHPGGRRRDRVRGSRRAVLGRRGADPQRALPAHLGGRASSPASPGCWTRPTRRASSAWCCRAARAWSTASSTRSARTADRLLILHNDGAENFELVGAPLADPAAWKPLIAHRADTRLLGVDAFADSPGGLLPAGRADRAADPARRRHRARGGLRRVGLHRASPGCNPEYETSGRSGWRYVSLVTPDSVYDCDMATGDAHPAPAAAGAARPGRHASTTPRTTSSTASGPPRRRHAGPDLAGLPEGHAARRQRPVPALRLRQLRDLDRPGLLHPAALPARPRLLLRDRAHPRRRRDGPPVVRRRASCCTRPTRSPTSSPAPSTWSGQGWTSPSAAGRPGRHRRAGC